jgi:hypothetical protein
LHAEPVRGHRRVIIGTGAGNPVTILRTCRGGRLIGRPPALSGQIDLVPAVLPLSTAVAGAERAAARHAVFPQRCAAGGWRSGAPEVRMSQTSS